MRHEAIHTATNQRRLASGADIFAWPKERRETIRSPGHSRSLELRADMHVGVTTVIGSQMSHSFSGGALCRDVNSSEVSVWFSEPWL